LTLLGRQNDKWITTKQELEAPGVQMRMRSVNFYVVAPLLFVFSFLSSPAYPQTSAAPSNRPGTPEQRAARAFEKARANPIALRAFLVRMPKGGDLHNHLDGAVYAESRIRAGTQDGLCVTLEGFSFIKPDGLAQSAPPSPVCADGQVPVGQAFRDQPLYDSIVDAFSMRSFVPAPGRTGHDHFFDTFAKFVGTDSPHMGEWLDELATRAVAQNEQYLEIMPTLDFTHTAAMAKQIGWREDLAGLRGDLLEAGLRDDVAVARTVLDNAESLRRARERCGQKDEAAACKVQIRYVYQVLRGFPKEQVFAQTLLGFEIADDDSRVVGLNFVMPEDGAISMGDYEQHMRMIGFLHGIYPPVHISLHAGELAQGLVPPEGLCCHIRLAVEQAHAERIGHGVDVMFEERPYELLKEMAQMHVMVEINLTSNDVILGVSGNEHPLPLYRQYGVPVALSTDDEGVSRIDITHEYVRAAKTYGLSYPDLKQIARTSLEHSFLPGMSLWSARDIFTHAVAACSADSFGADKPSSACSAFLKTSERAQQQWELERRFKEFESGF
jgi:adenosine deaminase